MKILVISQYFYPESFRINDIVKELVNRNHDVTVVTGLPNYPEGKIYPGYENAYRNSAEYYGAKVYRCHLRPRKKGSINLVLNYFSFVIQAKKVLKKMHPDFDVIYVYEPSPITVALPAIWYKKRCGIPVYFYCMDQWPDSVLGNGIDEKNIIYIGAKFVSKYVYKNVSVIGIKCEEFNDYIYSISGVEAQKIMVLYEHAENSYLAISDEPIDNGIIDFMFLGNIGTAQNCGMLVRAFAKTDYKNKAKLHFVGDGSCMSELQNIVKELNLKDDVIFHGKHPVEEINSYYELADVCLLSLIGGNACGMTPPGKLFGYLAAARAIVAAINGPSARIIIDSKSGYVVNNDDIDGLVSIMQKIIDSPESILELGKNGREYFLKHYTLAKHVDELINQLNYTIEIERIKR